MVDEYFIHVMKWFGLINVDNVDEITFIHVINVLLQTAAHTAVLVNESTRCLIIICYSRQLNNEKILKYIHTTT
jgi:translation initiation factor 2 beta subunit (eIF-2beta)/eIF-5